MSTATLCFCLLILLMATNNQPCIFVNVSHQLLYKVVEQNKTQGRSHLHFSIFEAICKVNKPRLHVNYTERIERQIRVKIGRFLPKFYNSRRGGKQKQLFEAYIKRAGDWKFKILYTEYKHHEMIQENASLRLRLSQAITEKHCLRKKLSKSERAVKRYKELLVKWSRKHLNKQRGRNARINKGTYSRSQRFRHKKQLKDDCCAALSFLELTDYQVKNIVVKNKTSGKVETITVLNDCNDGVNDSDEETPENIERLQHLNMAMLVKTKFNISDEAYNSFAKISNLPRLYSVKKQMTNCQDYIPISRTPVEEKPGVQRDLKVLIETKLPELVDSEMAKDGKIRIKISGDGTQVGKYIHFVNVSAVFLDDEENVNSPYGNYTIAIINDEEEYTALKKHLKDIISDIETFTEISYNGESYAIEYSLAGDYKFLLSVCGLMSANSSHSCIYCDIHKDKFPDPNSKGTERTVEGIAQMCSRKSKGCIRIPLFPMIPIRLVVVDILHMFLRISGVLISLLILELRKLDAIENTKTFKTFDRNQYRHLAEYEEMLSRIHIKGFSFYIGKESKTLKYRDLTGPEKLQLFNNIDMVESLLSDVCPERANKIVQIWKDYFFLHKGLSSLGTANASTTPSEFKIKAHEWLKLFLSVYLRKNVTPYMHIFVEHASDIVLRLGPLNNYSTQGLEKLNSLTTLDYFKGTNHRLGVSALSQIMHKQNRMTWLQLMGVKLQKQTRKCSKCRLTGHDIRTCPMVQRQPNENMSS